MRSRRSPIWGLVILGLSSCRAGSSPEGRSAPAVANQVVVSATEHEERSASPRPAALRPPGSPKRAMMKSDADGRGRGPAASAAKGYGGRGPREAASAEPKAEPTRSWFPETFLFRPLVVTDAGGAATVSVRVPDRLTSWRVLALAHSRNGAQAGAETRFLGTLGVYVEVLVPPELRAGDSLRVPVTLVNTKEHAVETELELSAVGVQLKRRRQQVRVPARGSIVVYQQVVATAIGKARILARLKGADAVVRELRVIATGRPVRLQRRGTLGAPRELLLSRPRDAEQGLGAVRVQVFPGALALLRAELGRARGAGGSVAADAFALLLAAKAPPLLAALGGVESDPAAKEAERQAVRDLRILATQRLLRHSRHLDIAAAALVVEAAAAHGQEPLLSRLAKRALDQIARRQAPDGTCGGMDGWALQRLLVATADCVRAAKDRPRVRIRAAQAFARHGKAIDDPYTAAAVLASRAVDAELAKRLRSLVLAAIKPLPDGSKFLVVPSHVVRADGRHPRSAEASALAILALSAMPQAPLADLGAGLLGNYSPGAGWGDGRANLVCFNAVVRLFAKAVPAAVRIELRREGQLVAHADLAGRKLREVLVLETPAGWPKSGQQQRWTLSATPPLPGLAYSFELSDTVPWPAQIRGAGVELAVTPPRKLVVGHPAHLAIRAALPGGRHARLTLQLPAGVAPDRKELEGLVSRRLLRAFSLDDARLVLDLPRLRPGRAFATKLRVIPAFAGVLSAGAATLGIGSHEVFELPKAWTVSAR